jgi:hypothetical protein
MLMNLLAVTHYVEAARRQVHVGSPATELDQSIEAEKEMGL